MLFSHIDLSRFGLYMPPGMWVFQRLDPAWQPRQDATPRSVFQPPPHPSGLPKRTGVFPSRVGSGPSWPRSSRAGAESFLYGLYDR